MRKLAEITTAAYAGDQILRQRFGTPDIPIQLTISESMSHYLESFDYFFVATSDRKGECDASFRGRGNSSSPAIKILDERTLIFPHYMGNGSFRSLGNILENPHIGMLFIDLATGARTRLNGGAEINANPEWLAMFPGAIQIVKVTVAEVYKQNRPIS